MNHTLHLGFSITREAQRSNANRFNFSNVKLSLLCLPATEIILLAMIRNELLLLCLLSSGNQKLSTIISLGHGCVDPLDRNLSVRFKLNDTGLQQGTNVRKHF